MTQYGLFKGFLVLEMKNLFRIHDKDLRRGFLRRARERGKNDKMTNNQFSTFLQHYFHKEKKINLLHSLSVTQQEDKGTVIGLKINEETISFKKS